MTLAPAALADVDWLDELDARLTALSAEIAGLTEVLSVLGRLPECPGLFIPIDASDLAAPTDSDIAHRYSPVPRMGKPLTDPNASGLGDLGARRPADVDLGALNTGYALPAHNIRLQRDLDEEEATTALCVELSALAGPPLGIAPIRAG